MYSPRMSARKLTVNHEACMELDAKSNEGETAGKFVAIIKGLHAGGRDKPPSGKWEV
jgi:hypothetical protein